MKLKSLLNLLAIATLATVVFISCSKDDEIDNIEEPDAESLTCKIDGATFTASTFHSTLIGDDTGKRLDIRGTDESGKQLIITINDIDPLGTNFSHLGDTVYVDIFENTPQNIMTLGTYRPSAGSFLMTTGDGKEAGYSILTSCDLVNNKISGVFEFQLIDFETDEIIYVTEGMFSNLTFSEL